MASIHPNGSGWRVHYSQDGKRLKSPTFPSQEGAARWIADTLPATKVATMFDLIDLWEKDLPSPHRCEAAVRLRVAAKDRGWGDPRRICGADLDLWQKASPCPRYGAYLATVLQWAIDRHHLPIRPDAAGWRPPRYKRKPAKPLLDDAQARAIRSAAGGYGREALCLVDYLMTYGGRPVTACLLTLGDLDVKRCELVIDNAKHSGGWRHPVLERHVEQWTKLHGKSAKPTDPLFPRVGVTPRRPWKIIRGSAREMCDWYKGTIGKRVRLGELSTIYNLKRYAITMMLRKGIDPATIARFTGHLNEGQVLKYAKTNGDLQRAALAKLPVPRGGS